MGACVWLNAPIDSSQENLHARDDETHILSGVEESGTRKESSEVKGHVTEFKVAS